MLILWTYHDEHQDWVEEKNLFDAIERIIDTSWKRQVLIATTGSPNDFKTVISTLKIIRRFKDNVHVIVGMAHPTTEYVHDLLEHGANEIWAVNSADRGFKREFDLSDSLTINKKVCPALHIKSGDPIELSVCGKRNNRLILVMHHFKKWCLADYTTCPHWLGTNNDC